MYDSNSKIFNSIIVITFLNNKMHKDEIECHWKKVHFVADCISGTYRSAGGCQNCPVGTYQDLKSKESCKACPSDRNTTETTGATSLSFCISKWIVLKKFVLITFCLVHSYLRDEWMFLLCLQPLVDDYVGCILFLHVLEHDSY